MKKTIGMILLGFILITFSSRISLARIGGNKQMTRMQTHLNSQRVAVIYYSLHGTTRRVAKRVQQLTGGDLYELSLADPYTGDDYAVSDRVFAERNASQMPEFIGKLPDLDKYDCILIGTPVWNESLANPVISYLQQTDFSGKTVAPFWVYITNQGNIKSDFQQYLAPVSMSTPLNLQSPSRLSDKQLDSKLQNWLDKL